MILKLRGNMASVRRLRICIVAGVLLALLAFPCGPLVAAVGSGQSHAAGKVMPAHSDHGEADCTHRVKEHESSCCKDCSSWLMARPDDGANVVPTYGSSHRDIPTACLTGTSLSYGYSDLERRLTGPPTVAPVDGTSIYLKTHRYRI